MVPTKHCRKSIGLWIRRVAASAFAGVRHAERLFKRDDGFLSLCGDPSSPAASVHHDVRKAGVSACAPIAGTEITRIPVPAENLIRGYTTHHLLERTSFLVVEIAVVVNAEVVVGVLELVKFDRSLHRNTDL